MSVFLGVGASVLAYYIACAVVILLVALILFQLLVPPLPAALAVLGPADARGVHTRGQGKTRLSGKNLGMIGQSNF